MGFFMVNSQQVCPRNEN